MFCDLYTIFLKTVWFSNNYFLNRLYFWDFLIVFNNSYLLERFWEHKECPKGRIWRAKTEQTSMKKRGANLRAKKSPLGVVLVRFGVDFQGVLGSTMLIFHWIWLHIGFFWRVGGGGRINVVLFTLPFPTLFLRLYLTPFLMTFSK